MSGAGRRAGLWVAAIVAAAATLGTLGTWWRRSADPVSQAERAYEQGDWQRAAAALRGPLKTAAVPDPAALRIYARSLARLERDEAANAIYARLGRAAL